MNNIEKEKYLNLYLLQNITIQRLSEQIKISKDKKEEYNEKIHKAKLLRDKIEKEIESLSNPVEREVLSFQFLCGKSLEETAEILNFTKTK